MIRSTVTPHQSRYDESYCRSILEETIEMYQQALHALNEEAYDTLDDVMQKRLELLQQVQELGLTEPDRMLSQEVINLCARVRRVEEDFIEQLESVTQQLRLQITEVYGHRQKLSQYNKSVKLLDDET